METSGFDDVPVAPEDTDPIVNLPDHDKLELLRSCKDSPMNPFSEPVKSLDRMKELPLETECSLPISLLQALYLAMSEYV